MSTLLNYSLHSESPSASAAATRFADYRGLIDEWIGGKGNLPADFSHAQPVPSDFELKDGRIASLAINAQSAEQDGVKHDLMTLHLSEPLSGGTEEEFVRTNLDIATTGATVALSSRIQLVTHHHRMGPASRVDLQCPRVIRMITSDQSNTWYCGQSPINHEHLAFEGTRGATALQNLIWDRNRTLPIVVISADRSFPPRNVVQEFSRDLFAVATIASLDYDGAWEFSGMVDENWSCYGGAVRLYWPIDDTSNDPSLHRYWRRHTFLWGSAAERALQDERQEIKNAIFAQAANLQEPSPIISARKNIQTAHLESLQGDKDRTIEWLRSEVGKLEDESRGHEAAYLELLQNSDSRVAMLEAELRSANTEIEQLKSARQQQQRTIEVLSDRSGDQSALRSDSASSQDGTVEVPEEPQSVEDAVTIGRRVYSRLVFGKDVADGVSRLDPKAGPPAKILEALKAMNRYATAKMGQLGMADEEWFRNEGVDVSPEFPSTLLNERQAGLRTFDNGSAEPLTEKKSTFTLHAKMGKGSAGRVVRIYFYYDADRMKTIIGWIGPKPNLV